MGCLVHVHADAVELGLERLRIVRQRHRDIHRRAVHERQTGEVTPPPVYRDAPRPTLVDSPSLLPFLRREHVFLHTLRLRLSRQPIRKHLPTGAGTVHSISRVSGPEALPTMGSGSPGKPPHVCGASMCGHTCVACYPRIRSRDLGWFRMMRPWDSLRDDRAHCSAPYVISFSGNNLLHIHHPSRQRRPVWTLDKLLV